MPLCYTGTMADDIFRFHTLNLPKLRVFGFVQNGDAYQFSQPLLDGDFTLVVTVAQNGTMSSAVYERDGEEYIPYRLKGASGSFVGDMRLAYEDLAARILHDCYDKAIFTAAQTQEVIAFAARTWGNEPEYLWEKFPDNAVLRRSDNNKWYAALLTVAKNKLGLDGAEKVEILDIRADPAELQTLIDGTRYFAGYHMNKKHWLTIVLDGRVPTDEIVARLKNSYELAAGKK